MNGNVEKPIVVWIDELQKTVFIKEKPNTVVMEFSSAEALSKFVSNGYYKIG